MSGTERERSIVDITIAAPPQAVWRALRDPEQIGNWFGWDADSLGEEIAFIFFDHARADEATGVIQFEPWEGNQDRIAITPAPGGTRLRLVRQGERAGEGQGAYDEIEEGWHSFFAQLRFGLERHAARRRRTIYLSGYAQAPLAPVGALLGLPALTAERPGTPFGALLPMGDRVDGALWHLSPHQVGVQISALGPGLLVAMDRPVTGDHKHGGASVILTTYGLDPAQFDALARRWGDWWAGLYPNRLQVQAGRAQS